MTYTAFRVTWEGAWFHREHVARLAAEGASRAAVEAAFGAFVSGARPGAYVARWKDGTLDVQERGPSVLRDGMPTRLVVSPYADRRGAFAKMAPPNAYADVRVPGVATLLTDRAGVEFLESCTASILAWDGHAWVAVPEDAPRVASVAEVHVLSRMEHRRAPVAVGGRWPLVLLNALAGAVVPALEGRDAPPVDAVMALRDIVRKSTAG